MLFKKCFTRAYVKTLAGKSLPLWNFPRQIPQGSICTAPNRSAIVRGIKTDQNDSMLVNWDHQKGAWSRFHYEWLRDNCRCPKCFHPDTAQRILRTIVNDARPDSVKADDEQVEIKWKDGHSSQFVLSWLLENSYCHRNIKPPGIKKPTLTFWDTEYFRNRELPSVDYEEYMKSDEELLKMLQKFRQYGLCFIHNTPVSEEATGDALRRIGPLRRTYYGGDVWSFVAGNLSIKCVCVYVHACIHAFVCLYIHVVGYAKVAKKFAKPPSKRDFLVYC